MKTNYTIQTKDYKGWKNSIYITNNDLEAIILTDIGPRIISFKTKDSDNIFYEAKEHLGKSSGKEWINYGGHRLWHAPEEKPRTYHPDNSVVSWKEQGNVISFTQEIESSTGIQKEISVEVLYGTAGLKVTHRLWNKNLWAIELAPWALSVLDRDTLAFLPLPQKTSHDGNLLPVSNISLWGYTDLTDSRFRISSKYITVQQDSKKSSPQKIGIWSQDGWGASYRKGVLFIKFFPNDPANYPDRGCNLEVFTNQKFIELESLGKLQKVQPNQYAEHIEYWFIHKIDPQVSIEDLTNQLPSIIQEYKKFIYSSK